MKIECSIVSDVGMHRSNNEDNFYANGFIRQDVDDKHIENHILCEDGHALVAIFDGMGGEDRGEYASLEAAKEMRKYQNTGFEKIVSNYVTGANRCVCEMMDDLSGKRSGSTVSIAQISGGELSICTLGDSPIFVFHRNKIKKISVDHNEAQRMVDLGILTEEEARNSAQKHKLTQHLGIYEEEMLLEPYVREHIQLETGDKLLLCSDGLTDMVEAQDIEEVLCEDMEIHQQAKILVELALDNGGRDNVTVILVNVGDG